MWLPDGWLVLDLDRKTSALTTKRMLDAACLNDPGLAKGRAHIEQLLIQMSADAAAAGMRFCACFATVVGDDDLTMQASVSIAVHRLGPGGNSVDQIQSELADEESKRAVGLLDTDGGRAVRRSGHRKVQVPGLEEQVEILSQQYYVPVPHTTNQVVILTFTTPTLALEDKFAQLFDTMAQTFTFSWDEPVATSQRSQPLPLSSPAPS